MRLKVEGHIFDGKGILIMLNYVIYVSNMRDLILTLPLLLPF